jgi:hypothetical protein
VRGGVRPLTHFPHQSTELGGPIFDPESGDSNGSVLVLEAESVVAVRAILEEDPYWKGEVVRVVLTAHKDPVYLQCCFALLLVTQWNKEKIEIKRTDLTIVGAMQPKA